MKIVWGIIEKISISYADPYEGCPFLGLEL
jgi:hypothetical protein